MVNPLSAFSVVNDSRGYGGILFLSWEYPTTLPAAWKLYIFKHQGSAVTDQQISDYFDNKLNPADLAQLGIFVYNNLPAKTTFIRLQDFKVENSKNYFYRVLIRDTSTNENSATIDGNETPESEIYLRVIDAKDVVARALEKTLEAVKTTEGYHPQIEKDIRVFKAHNERQKEDNFFVVSRTSGQNINRTLSDIIAQMEANTIRGEIDYDILQVEWICMGVGERRDKYTQIMRGMRTVFRHYAMLLGEGAILDVQTVMIGDSEVGYGRDGTPAMRGVMNVVVQTEQMLQIGRNDLAIWEILDQSYTSNDQSTPLPERTIFDCSPNHKGLFDFIYDCSPNEQGEFDFPLDLLN